MNTELDLIDVNSNYQRQRQQRRAAVQRRGAYKRKRMLSRLYAAIVCLLGLAVFLAAANIFKALRVKKGEYTREYMELTQNYKPNRPKTIEPADARSELEALLGEYPEFSDIYENADLYPEKLLAALCNNPEMYEFVKGYPEAGGSVTDGFTDAELSEKYPLILQWDKRWGYASYGDSMIGLAGCGPTCLSMVITALTEENGITPDKIASYSMENGYYVEGTGTAWSLMTEGVMQYGITAREISLNENVMKDYLDRGCPIICSMRPGDFTAAGHFIVIYGYGEEGFCVNDPNCIERSGRQWTFEELSGQIRILWAYEK